MTNTRTAVILTLGCLASIAVSMALPRMDYSVFAQHRVDVATGSNVQSIVRKPADCPAVDPKMVAYCTIRPTTEVTPKTDRFTKQTDNVSNPFPRDKSCNGDRCTFVFTQ